MLIWNKEVWLIDNGAAFYFHHSWSRWQEHAINPFAFISDHVLLKRASLLEEVDVEFRALLTDGLIRQIVALIPDDWLQWENNEQTAAEIRDIYAQFLITRRTNSFIFIKEAQNARESAV